MALRQACEALQRAGVAARVLGPGDVRFESVSTDTRTLARGALYVALRGERFDGHDFAAAAAQAGAVALLVERDLGAAAAGLPQLVVEDTREGFGRLAAAWRAGRSLTLIAVAGSNGKTTTTQMIASVLASALAPQGQGGAPRWFATRGNRNNDVGVPQMLLELRPGHEAAVLEIGMNHPGEIARLAGWVRPTVALITNAQREHQEFFDSARATAQENGQLIAALAPGGTAVFPADDACADLWRGLAGARRALDFALQGPAAVRARATLDAQACTLDLEAPQGAARVRVELGGEHSARNALAAAAACLAAGIGLPAIAAGLAAFRPVAGRGTRRRLAGGAELIDESYNANPDSVRAAIDLLARQPGWRVLVFGDMGEVGARAAEFHREIGLYARARGIERLLALGEQARAAADAFGAGASHFDSVEELCEAARGIDGGPGTFLVKGSRFMRMERVVSGLERGAGEGGHA